MLHPLQAPQQQQQPPPLAPLPPPRNWRERFARWRAQAGGWWGSHRSDVVTITAVVGATAAIAALTFVVPM
jgi:hypothetical protein